jgi:NifU-like protein involved in Fe-S cluster formation
MALPIVGNSKSDIGGSGGKGWMYTDLVKDHFFNPRNLLENTGDVDVSEFNGYGQVGSPACGDMMKLWVKIDPETDRVIDCKWQTFGCASAIASTSMMSVMAIENGGMTSEEAMSITPNMIMERLGGLPNRKIHCSVLGDKALTKAINDYYRQTKQFDRMKVQASKVVDPDTNVTDMDIQEAVLEGATDMETLQSKLKVAIGNPEVIPEVEKLLHFYVSKYYGDE